MEALSRLIIGDWTKNLEKRNMVWNMIGSFLYAFASMVLTIAVVQIAGEDAGGIFTFAFTTFGQHMFTVGYFGIRPFQITDTSDRYSFGDYFGLRLMTCAFALAVGLAFVLVNDYTVEKAGVVFFMVVYKVIDALADTYEAEFQRRGHLHLTGKANAFRTAISVTAFLCMLAATKNLLSASMVAVQAQVVGFLIFDAMIIRYLSDVNWKSEKGKKFQLLRINTVLFFSVILDFYIFSAAKYAIEGNMLDRDMALFGAIFMPTSVINLVANFVIRPYLTKLSIVWAAEDMRKFIGLLGQLSAVIAALTVLAVGGAWLLGIPVLSILYPNLSYMLAECRPALILIILGGALNAYMCLFYYALVIMEKQRFIFVGYVLVGALAVLISGPFVRSGGIFGAALSYTILMAVLMAIFGALILIFIGKRDKR